MPTKTRKKQSPAGTKTTQTAVFQAAYGKLNEQQRQAVDTLEGPVLVVAGPGTGKTQVIALRTANILQRTQMRPSNILCLTFSVSGAIAMRERLRSLIGSDAYGVTVQNFHSFCNNVIAEYPLVFEAWSALEQISDVERYRELNKIIDQMLPDVALVNKKQPYRRTRDILSRLSQIKREGTVDSAALQEIADEYEAELADKSKPGTKAHERNLLTARKFRELLDIFARYQAMLKQTQRYDYDDMILYVTQALREEEWLLQSLQERYQYILVDEFQDTNGAQYDLVELLTTYPTVDHLPNVFAVGDDDQAIYRFQGANIQNVLKFRSRFPQAPVIALTTSYRCPQPVLDAASQLITHNTQRLVGQVEGLDKTLRAAKDDASEPPALLFSPSDITEPWLIADLVQERIDGGTEPQEIAILVQKNQELEPLYDVLSARGIPVQMSGKVDLLSHHLVQETVAILRAISTPRDNAKFAAALGCACFGCHPADLGRLYAELRDPETTQSCLLDLLLDIDTDESLHLQDRERLLATRDVLLDLHNKLGSRTVVETVEHVLKDTGLLPITSNLLPQSPVSNPQSPVFDPLDYAALQEFFERLKYRAYEQPSFSLATFLSDLEYYEQADYAELRLSYDLPHLTEAGVQLMTAHQSKGLEFDTVILANFRHGHWDEKRAPAAIAVPEDRLFGWQREQERYERTQDERRVAYVAMTRAKRELIFTCPKQLTTGDKLRDVSPSGFFAEAGNLPEMLRELNDPAQASAIVFAPAVITDEAYQAFLKQRLETYQLSVTALNHFLDDPQRFLIQDLLQVPQTIEPSMVYGNAVHEALKKWGLQQMENGKWKMENDQSTFSTSGAYGEAEFLQAFREYLATREILTDAERARLTKLGEESLPRYFEQRLAGQQPVVHWVEHKLTTALGDIPIKGTIDRLDLREAGSAHCIIVDYKTGRPQTEKQIKDGDYFRQLTFYALLLKHGAPILKPEKYILDFVGESSEHPVEREFAITESDQKELTEIVKAVWAKITALDFTAL